MESFLKILLSGLLIWLAYRTYRLMRHNPQWLNRQDLSRSFTTMGLLALGLIALIAFMVLLLRQ